MQEDGDLILEGDVKANSWAIRPCQFYKDEYRECKSIKGRFQQYFVHGDTLDCSTWEHDFEDCEKFEKQSDYKAGKKIIEHEAERRKERMKAHYGNDIWKKRSGPPEDWNKPLPEYIQKEYVNSFLEIKSKEMKGEPIPEGAANSMQTSSFCTIM